MKSDRIHAVLTTAPLLLLIQLIPPRVSLHVNYRSREEIALFFQTTVFYTPRKCVRCCLESCLPLRQSRGVRLVNTFQLRFNKYCLCCRNLTLLLTLQRIEVFLSVAKKMVEWSEATWFKSKQKNDPFASHTFYLFQLGPVPPYGRQT